MSDRSRSQRSAARYPAWWFAATVSIATLASGTAAVASSAAEALQAAIDVERGLLLEDVQEHESLVARRAQIQVRLQNLYATLDAAVREDPVDIETVRDLLVQVEDAERARSQVIDVQRFRVRTVLDRARRIRELETRAGVLRDEGEATAGPLTATWEISLLPSGQRGVFRLEQTGVLVSGTYTLEGGWTGSLQGTLVNRKIYLVRIDSKLGRSMEFEGFLASDGQSIRGTWLNYDLGAEGGAEGQWSAARVRD